MKGLIPLFEGRSHPLVNEQLKKACACPDCGARYHALIALTEHRVHSPRYAIGCTECKYLGPFGKGLENAVARWNRRPSFLTTLIKRLNRNKTRRFHKKALT